MRRVGLSGRAISAAFCAAVLLAACTPPAPAPGTGSPPSASAAGSGTRAPAAPPEPVAADWKNFTTSDGKLAFDYPAEWTVKDRAAEAAPDGVFVEVLSAAGKSMAILRTNIVTRPECTAEYPYSLLISEELPALKQGRVTPRFVFEGRANPTEADPAKATVLAYGITSQPDPTAATACPIFHYFTWPPSAAMFGGVYNPLDTTPGNPPHVDTPEAYTQTAEFQNVRHMISSLRPAGT